MERSVSFCEVHWLGHETYALHMHQGMERHISVEDYGRQSLLNSLPTSDKAEDRLGDIICSALSYLDVCNGQMDIHSIYPILKFDTENLGKDFFLIWKRMSA